MELDGNIKNIIFDLGGVILTIDPVLTIKAFQKLGLSESVSVNGWSYEHELFLKMEKGEISDIEFRDGIRSMLPNEKTDIEIDAAWCAMIIDFPFNRIGLLKELSKFYRLFLFSNTNNIHLNYFRKLFSDLYHEELDSLFEKTFYSHELGLRKPEVESFQLVLKDAGLNPEETLFIDDSDKNIEGATHAKMQAFHITPEKTLNEIFEGY